MFFISLHFKADIQQADEMVNVCLSLWNKKKNSYRGKYNHLTQALDSFGLTFFCFCLSTCPLLCRFYILSFFFF